MTFKAVTDGGRRLARGAGLLLLALLCNCALQAQVLKPTGTFKVPTGVSAGNTTGTTNTNTSNPNSPNYNPFANDSTNADTSATKGLEYHTEIPDSILRQKVFLLRYNPTRVWIEQAWNPTLDPTGAQFNDALDALNGNYYLGKGFLGHPHTSLFPTLADGLTLRLQPDLYEGYYMRPDNIDFYQTLTPYTVLSYGSSLKKDYSVRVSHTQNIMPGWNAAFTYRLLNPEGVYTSSGATTHYLNATTNYFSTDSRLQAAAGIIWHSFRIDENDGLVNDSIFTYRLQTNRAGIPVNLVGASSRQRDLNLFGRATYSLERQSDKYRYRDSVVARTTGDSVTVLDTIEVVDTIPLRQPHMINAGVVGIELGRDRRKRTIADSTWWVERTATLFWTNDAYPTHRWRNPLKVTAGIKPHSVTAVVDGDTMTLASLFDPFARAEVAILRGSLTLEADMRSNFNYEMKPDSRFAATLYYPFDSARLTWLSLSATAQNQAPDVRLIHDALAGQNMYLSNIATERYRLRFHHRDIVDLDLRANHMNHNTWYNLGGNIVEGTEGLWLMQGSLTLRLAVGPVHLDMQQLLQHSTDSVQMPTPLWATKNSLYVDLNLFRNTLRAQIGADLRYHTAYYAPSYDPYTGLFMHQNDILIGDYIWADVFLNLQVKRASIYLKAGHVNAIWETQPNYFILPHYPGQRFGLLWGITWAFFD